MQNILKTAFLISIVSLSAWAACSTDLDMSGNKVVNVDTPTTTNDTATKIYVDTAVAKPTVIAPEGYGVIYAGGHYWLDRNLGATKVCESVEGDAECWGDLYQWGRPADGHEKRDSATVAGPTSDIQPEHGDFITVTVNANPNSWLDTNAIYLWSTPGSTNNGVCPDGWSVPTEQDFKDVGITNSSDAFAKLKLSESGGRTIDYGTVSGMGILGFVWTSTVDGERSRRLRFGLNEMNFFSQNRAIGYPVRCIKH